MAVTLGQHRAQLEAMRAAMVADRRKTEQVVRILQCYLAAHGLRGTVAADAAGEISVTVEG